MTSQTHTAIGITTALLVIQPKSFAEIVCATAGGIIGGAIADIDLNNHKGHKDNKKDVLLWEYNMSFAGILLIVDYILGNGVCKYVLGNINEISLACSFLIVIGLAFGYRSSHRSFMHSIFALCLFTAMVWVVFKPLAIAFGVGYLSHILLDLTNKTRIQLLFPFKKRMCLNWCSSNGKMDRVLLSFGKIIGGSLICLFILRARVVYYDGSELFVMLNRQMIGGIRLLHCYLIIINIIAFITFKSVYSHVDSQRDETKERQGLYFWFFELLCLIGGAIGILFSMLVTEQPLGKHSATMYVYTFAMIETWSVLYMIIVNPFRQTLTAIQRIDLSSHRYFVVYFSVINIVLLLIILIDRNNRHNKWSKIETVEVLLGLMGGSFLISFVDWFCNFRGNAVFGWAFSILCATHTFAIGYLLCVGLI